MNQRFVIDNRADTPRQIGMLAVKQSPAEGCTLTVLPTSFLITNKSVFKSLQYDPETDFSPVSQLVNQPMVLVVTNKQKYPAITAWLAAAKAAPGNITYAASYDGSP